VLALGPMETDSSLSGVSASDGFTGPRGPKMQ